jgi:signal transduction histidine kinase
MQTLVRECLDTLDHEVANRVLDVQIGELPQCPGDPPMLRQMWMNLLGNAVKYTRDRSPAVISVRGEMRDRWCVYEVEDNGAGFDMTYAGKLFQPFQRLHSEAEFPGTGIGLALVHRIVHRHGGSISASSGPAGGALFRVTLPAC